MLKIFVTDLLVYNKGYLFGEWITLPMQEELGNTFTKILKAGEALSFIEEGNKEKVLYARYYHPTYNWEWYAMEYSKLQRLFFGLVENEELEYGYFSLDELERLGAIRDWNFRAKILEGEDYGKRAV